MKKLFTLCLSLCLAAISYAQPANDSRCSPTSIAIGDVFTATNVNATEDPDDAQCGSENLHNSVWFTFIGNGNPVDISTCGINTDFDTDIGIFQHMINFGGCWFGQGMPAGCSSTGTPVECEFGGSNNALANVIGFPTTNGAQYYVRLSSHFVNQTGSFDFEIIDQTAAPVVLENFWGETSEKGNAVMWETSSESNVLWHVIEKSKDGIGGWTEAAKLVSTIAAEQGAFYEIIDNSPFNLTYYRLKVVNYDGSEQFSEVISVARPKAEFEIVNVYPNPIYTGEVTLQINSDHNEEVNVRVLNLAGQRISTFDYQVRNGINKMAVDVSEWTSGVYFIEIAARHGYSTRKIFKQE